MIFYLVDYFPFYSLQERFMIIYLSFNLLCFSSDSSAKIFDRSLPIMMMVMMIIAYVSLMEFDIMAGLIIKHCHCHLNSNLLATTKFVRAEFLLYFMQFENNKL